LVAKFGLFSRASREYSGRVGRCICDQDVAPRPRLGFSAVRRLVGVLAGVMLAAGSLVATGVAPAGAGGDPGPVGYTTRFTPGACGLATVDLGAGGSLTPIGSPYIANVDGCPDDLAIRAGDPKIWAVITYPFQSTTGTGDATGLFPGPGAGSASASDETPTTSAGSPPPSATRTGRVDAAAIESDLVTIDPKTGTRTRVGSLGFDVFSESSGLAFDAAGTLWLYGATNDPACSPEPVDRLFSCLYRLDPATGAATFVARGPVRPGPKTAGTVLFGATATCDAVLTSVNDLDDGADGPSIPWLATVSTTDAALGRAPSPQGPPILLLTGIERDSTGALRAVGFADEAGSTPGFATFTVDPTTGVATRVAGLTTAGPPASSLGGLAIAGLTCPVVVTPVVVTPVVVTPKFTG